MRKAKIICTLGPSTDAPGVLEDMVREGMDVARLNFSHGTYAEHHARLLRVRAVAARQGRNVAVLQDIQGPKIRLGRFEGGRLLVRAGQRVRVVPRDVLGGGEVIPAPVRGLAKDLSAGDRLLLDDGRVELKVERVRAGEILSRVVVGGELKDKKGLHLPSSALSLPALTQKDVRDLAFGQRQGVDFVALSFVRRAEDLHKARAHIGRRRTPLIAKIEKPQAVENLKEIAAACDGVMVARGDLGVELPLEQLPAIQKMLLREANARGRLTIVATEMLESMIQNARPTRAEVSDVANAIFDGAGAVMLSGETAVGKNPVQAVATMARIVAEAERRGCAPHEAATDVDDEVSSGVAAAAVAAAHQLNIDTIVAYTESGHTAQLISEFRPRARVLGFTPNPEVVRRMALYWGVEARLVGRLQSTDAMLRQVSHLCRQGRLCPRGSLVVVVAGVPLNIPGNTNLLSIHRV